MDVRKVELEDANQIAEIYNFYVSNSHSTFETETVTVSKMQNRIGAIIENYPFFVCEQNGEIAAYAHAAEYKSRCAYRNSAEVSVYVKNGINGKGAGTMLYEKLLGALLQTDVHAVIAGIALPNEASIKLHEKFGFQKVAHFREIGFKFGCWIDVGYWEFINR